MNRKSLFFCLLMAPLMAVAATVKSPNGNIELKFSIDDQGRPLYEMSYKGRPVVLPSHLGLELARDKHASKGLKETDLMTGFTLKSEQTKEEDETWRPVWGETASYWDVYFDTVENCSKALQDNGIDDPEERIVVRLQKED